MGPELGEAQAGGAPALCLAGTDTSPRAEWPLVPPQKGLCQEEQWMYFTHSGVSWPLLCGPSPAPTPAWLFMGFEGCW